MIENDCIGNIFYCIMIKWQRTQSECIILKMVASEEIRFATGISEFDRVLGGGAVAGSLVLVGGAPGIGKSTLLLQMLSLIHI